MCSQTECLFETVFQLWKNPAELIIGNVCQVTLTLWTQFALDSLVLAPNTLTGNKVSHLLFVLNFNKSKCTIKLC